MPVLGLPLRFGRTSESGINVGSGSGLGLGAPRRQVAGFGSRPRDTRLGRSTVGALGGARAVQGQEANAWGGARGALYQGQGCTRVRAALGFARARTEVNSDPEPQPKITSNEFTPFLPLPAALFTRLPLPSPLSLLLPLPPTPARTAIATPIHPSRPVSGIFARLTCSWNACTCMCHAQRCRRRHSHSMAHWASQTR